jgi:hypothetical protein
MSRFLNLTLGALLLSTTLALAEDPEGSYAVRGTNPGKSGNYSGTVSVEKTGDTYRVVWNVGGTKYVGTGIGDAKFMAVSYKSGNSTGLAMYVAKGDGWEGIWTYAGGEELGTERWTRR